MKAMNEAAERDLLVSLVTKKNEVKQIIVNPIRNNKPNESNIRFSFTPCTRLTIPVEFPANPVKL